MLSFYEADDENFEFIPTVDGAARGLEFFLRKTGQRTGGWLSYTLSKSERTLQDSVPGFKFDFQYDRRHDLKLFLYHRLNNRWQFGFNWLYGSPLPRLFDQDGSDINEEDPNVRPPYPLRQSERIDPYRRVDLSASYHFKIKKDRAHF